MAKQGMPAVRMLPERRGGEGAGDGTGGGGIGSTSLVFGFIIYGFLLECFCRFFFDLSGCFR